MTASRSSSHRAASAPASGWLRRPRPARLSGGSSGYPILTGRTKIANSHACVPDQAPNKGAGTAGTQKRYRPPPPPTRGSARWDAGQRRHPPQVLRQDRHGRLRGFSCRARTGGTAGSSYSRTTRPYTQVRGAGGVSRRDGRQDQDMPSPTVHAGARPDGAAVDGTQKGRREPHTRGHQRCRNRYVAHEGRETPAAMLAHAWLVNYAFVLIILNHYIQCKQTTYYKHKER